jgi:KTSC domain
VRRRPVESTSLESVGYDSTEQRLEIEFKHGAIYEYLDVPAEVFEAFLAADSKGTFFNNDIKTSYDFARVSR